MDAVEIYRKMQHSPLFFIEVAWGLKPQPIKPEYQELVDDIVGRGNFNELRQSYFGTFLMGRHVTWQQWVIFLMVERAIRNEAPRRISISSGHGTGKDTTLAMLILWFLFCFKDAQIPCTAPSSEQMHDVLWKEVSVWLNKMEPSMRLKYEWSNTHIRIVESPETWFARARTARKETPEALAGVHGKHVMLIGDEASGIPNEIFTTAEGALTSKDVFFIMVSNPTRTEGFFYDSHHGDKGAWQTMEFDSNDSPIVDASFVSRIISKYGKDSDEYNIRVAGKFPSIGLMDEKGYVPLIAVDGLHFTYSMELTGRKWLGIDPAGEGVDEAAWVIRDAFKARIAHREKISTPYGIAQKTLAIMESQGIRPDDVVVDNFGVGANVAQYLASQKKMIRAVNVGESAYESDRFLNKRAEAYFKLRDWIMRGGELVQSREWQELLTIKFRREINGKIKIMGKEEMRKAGIKSPNFADALMLTFVSWSEDAIGDDYVQEEWKATSEYEGGEQYDGQGEKHPIFKGIDLKRL